jgi:hypothetical protein
MSVSYNTKIVTNGLVLALDAANSKSYPGSGTTWTDLSGRGNNGTLENSPSYSGSNGGTLLFNGTTQRVICGNASNLQITVGTISAWFNANNGNAGYNGIIAKQNAWGLFVASNVLVAYDWGNGAERSTGITVGNSSWNYVVMTFTETIGTPSNNAIVYLNGRPVLTTTIKHNNNTVQVMVGEANAGQYFGGNIAQTSIYNRVLSASEIIQNFNALRGRYDI